MSTDPQSDPTPGRPSLVNQITDVIETRPAIRSLALTGIFLMALLAMLYVTRAIAIPLTLALMLSFVFRPIVRALERVALPSVVGATVVVVLLVGLGGYAGVRLSGPAAEWTERLPRALIVLEHKVRPLKGSMGEVRRLAERVERLTDVGAGKHSPEVRLEQPGLASVALDTAVQLAAGGVVLLIGLYFLLIWGDTFLERIIRLVPDLRGQQRASTVIREIEGGMSAYLGTVSLINCGLGLAVGVSMAVLGMPNPVLWGVLAGTLNFIPYLGSVAGIVITSLAAFVTFPETGEALLPPAAYLVLTVLEGNVVTPIILGRRFRVSPLIIFVWLVFWAWLWGIAGALVAVPLLMLLTITCEQSEALAPVAGFVRR